MNLKRVSFGAMALLVLVSCGGKQNGMPEMPVGAYPTAVLAPQTAELQSVYPVVIKGQEDIEIRPRVDGTIVALYVDEGTVVRKGQALFKIDSPLTEQNILTAQAGVVNAEAQLRTAELNVEKTRPLAEKGIVSNYQLKTVENVSQSAKASLAQAKAILANAIANRSWATVSSPVDGVVGAVSYRLGSLVSPSIQIPLTTIANTSNVYAQFSWNEKELLDFLRGVEGSTQAEKIKKFPEVSLLLSDGTTYSEKGKIETISGVVNTTTGSANFRALFPNKQGLLRSGTSGQIIIPTHKENVFVIPQKATFTQQDKTLVYKVQGDSVVVTVVSALRMPDGASYAITQGLAEGDRIVVDGVATLRPNQKIKPE